MTDKLRYKKQISSSNDKDPFGGFQEDKNTLDSHRLNSQETMFEISVAPVVGKEPTSMLIDDYCEELAFSYSFPERKFSYKPTR